MSPPPNTIKTANLPAGNVSDVLGNDSSGSLVRQAVSAFVGNLLSIATNDPTGVATLRSDLTSLAAALTAADAFARPGDGPQSFSARLGGDPTTVSGLDPSGAVNTGTGRAYRIPGAGIVARRTPTWLEPSATYYVRARYQRGTDPSNPLGEVVKIGIAWLDQFYGLVSKQVVIQDAQCTAANSLRTQFFRVPSAPGDTISIQPPAGAVYFQPFVETLGSDGATQVVLLQSRDITGTPFISISVDELSARIDQIESQNLAPAVADAVAQVATLTNLIGAAPSASGVYLVVASGQSYAVREGALSSAFVPPDGLADANGHFATTANHSFWGWNPNAPTVPGTYFVNWPRASAPLTPYGSANEGVMLSALLARDHPDKAVYYARLAYDGISIDQYGPTPSTNPADGPDMFAIFDREIPAMFAQTGATSIDLWSWHQGRADIGTSPLGNAPSTYKARWNALYARMLARGYLLPSTPIIIYGINSEANGGAAGCDYINSVLQSIVADDPVHRTYVSTAELYPTYANETAPDERVHLNPDGEMVSGEDAYGTIGTVIGSGPAKFAGRLVYAGEKWSQFIVYPNAIQQPTPPGGMTWGQAQQADWLIHDPPVVVDVAQSQNFAVKWTANVTLKTASGNQIGNRPFILEFQLSNDNRATWGNLVWGDGQWGSIAAYPPTFKIGSLSGSNTELWTTQVIIGGRPIDTASATHMRFRVRLGLTTNATGDTDGGPPTVNVGSFFEYRRIN